MRRAVLLPNDKLSIANRHFRALFGAALENSEPERTIQLPNAEALLNAKPGAPDASHESDIDLPVLEVQANSLPDIYPEKDKKPKQS